MLKDISGSSSVFILSNLNNCVVALPGSNIVGTLNNNLQILNELSPELANIIKQGLVFPELNETISNLTQEMATLRNANPSDKPGIVKKIAENLDTMKKISDGVELIKPYAKNLYNAVKPFIAVKTGIDLPDW